jgi:hypothetical protein
VEVQPFALGSEDRNELHGAFDRAEPVGCPSRELDRLTWLDGEVLLAEQQTQAAA